MGTGGEDNKDCSNAAQEDSRRVASDENLFNKIIEETEKEDSDYQHALDNLISFEAGINETSRRKSSIYSQRREEILSSTAEDVISNLQKSPDMVAVEEESGGFSAQLNRTSWKRAATQALRNEVMKRQIEYLEVLEDSASEGVNNYISSYPQVKEDTNALNSTPRFHGHPLRLWDKTIDLMKAAKQKNIRKKQRGVRLMDVLEDDSALRSFRRFCRKEYSEENIMFYFESIKYMYCEEAEMKGVAENMIQKFILDSAQHQINLDYATVQGIKAKHRRPEASPTIFFEAQRSVLKLMMMDTFRRFRATPDFERFESAFMCKKDERNYVTLLRRVGTHAQLNNDEPSRGVVPIGSFKAQGRKKSQTRDCIYWISLLCECWRCRRKGNNSAVYSDVPTGATQ